MAANPSAEGALSRSNIQPLHLRVVVEPTGWSMTLGDGFSRPASGRVGPEALALLSEATAAPPRPRVMIPGRDAAVTRAEEAAGEALGALLRAAPEVHGRLRALAGRAAGQGAKAVLVIDAEDAAVRALPWELIALEGQLPAEVAGEVIVARLGVGSPAEAPPVGRGLWSRPWCVTPEEPTCARMLSHLRGLGLPEAGPAGGGVLHVIAHGRAGLDAVAVALEDSVDAGAAGERLAGALEGAALAVLAVCGAGMTMERELDDLAGRLLACGARSVVAPRRVASADALERFSAGLYGALAAGSPPAAAVSEARRAVRTWGHPHPASRWSGIAWFVRDLLAPAAGPLATPSTPSWRPDGWPAPDAEVGAWLTRARDHASARGDGYLGAEHLLSAMDRLSADGPEARQVRRWRAGALACHEAGTRSLTPQLCERGDRLTPRLRGWSARLEEGFDAEALCALLSEAPWPGSDAEKRSSASAAPPSDETWATAEVSGGPAAALEVVGGPEDGRRLTLAPGETLGRHAPRGGPTAALYQGTPLTDRKLSRRHLAWEGHGRVRLLRGGRLLRAGGASALAPGAWELRAGDRLLLTDATGLLALESP